MKKLRTFLLSILLVGAMLVPAMPASAVSSTELSKDAAQFYYQNALELAKANSINGRSSRQTEDLLYSNGGIRVQDDMVIQTILESSGSNADVTRATTKSVSARALDFWYRRSMNNELICVVTAGCVFDVVNGVSVMPGGSEYIKMDKGSAYTGVYVALDEGQRKWTSYGGVIGEQGYKFLYKYRIDFIGAFYYGEIGMSCDIFGQVQEDPYEDAFIW